MHDMYLIAAGVLMLNAIRTLGITGICTAVKKSVLSSSCSIR